MSPGHRAWPQVLKCSNLGEFLADPRTGRSTAGLTHVAAHLAAVGCSCPPTDREITPEPADRSRSPGVGWILLWDSAPGRRGARTRSNCCSSCPSAPRGGDTEEPLSVPPAHPTARRALCHPGSPHKHILVIQMRSCHKSEGPALNKEPLGMAEGDAGLWSPLMNANASIPPEQLLWEGHRGAL